MIKTALILILFTVLRSDASELYPEKNGFWAHKSSCVAINEVNHKISIDDENDDFDSSFLADAFNTCLELSHKINTTPKTRDDSDSEWSVDSNPLERLTSIRDDSAMKVFFVSAMQDLKNKKYKKALPLLHELASLNMTDAQCELGLCYFHGKGVKTNTKTARQFFQKAADQGHIKAQKKLAYFLSRDHLSLGIAAQKD